MNDHGDIPDFGDSRELLYAYAQWFHDVEISAFSDGEIHTVLKYNKLKRSFKNELQLLFEEPNKLLNTYQEYLISNKQQYSDSYYDSFSSTSIF